MKNFKDFLEIEDNEPELNESSFLSKGFALTQLTGFRGEFSKIKSALSVLKNLVSAIKREDDLKKKIDQLADAILVNASISERESEQRLRLMNTVVAEILLSQNIEKLLKNQQKKKRR